MNTELKEKRDISGMYFRFQNPNTSKWEDWVFEDLPEEEQDKILNSKEIEFVKGIAKSLARTINILAEQFDLTANIEHINSNQ